VTLNSPEVRVILIEATAKGQHHHARTLAAIGLAQIDVVEGGVSFPFSFQFCTRLAAVFAEEVGGFGSFVLDGII
jgi:hypothetical protein